MFGKFYSVYDVTGQPFRRAHVSKRSNGFGVSPDFDGECVGTFESIREICDFFKNDTPRAIGRNRIEAAICRGNRLTFNKKRYWVEVFKEEYQPKIDKYDKAMREALRKQYGKHRYKLDADGKAFYKVRGNKAWLPVEVLPQVYAPV